MDILNIGFQSNMATKVARPALTDVNTIDLMSNGVLQT
jgi:hypothetical protein